jgi:hypothetical protein
MKAEGSPPRDGVLAAIGDADGSCMSINGIRSMLPDNSAGVSRAPDVMKLAGLPGLSS